MAHVKITSHGSPASTVIEIDGQRVPRVREYRLGQDMHGCPVLELSILCTELEVETDLTRVDARPIAPDRRTMM